MRITIEWNRPQPTRWRRRRWAALGLTAALLIPAGALASHNFTDVPTGHLFHQDISDAYAARLTAGCTATTFCPDAPVTRGQMTAFLNRGLGRVGQANLTGSLVTTGVNVTLGTVTIRAGNVTGGTALVYLSASVNAYAIAAGCHCEVRIDLRDQNGGSVSPYVVADLPAIAATDNDTDVVTGIQGIAVVPTGVDRTFNLVGTRTVGTAAVLAYGRLDAIYVPFNGVGDPAGAAATAGGAAHPRD